MLKLKVHSRVRAPLKLLCTNSEFSKDELDTLQPAKEQNWMSEPEKSQESRTAKSKKHIRNIAPVKSTFRSVAREKLHP